MLEDLISKVREVDMDEVRAQMAAQHAEHDGHDHEHQDEDEHQHAH
jgi:hypothetical protein